MYLFTTVNLSPWPSLGKKKVRKETKSNTVGHGLNRAELEAGAYVHGIAIAMNGWIMEVLYRWCWRLADSHVNANVGDASMNACEFTHLSSDRKSQLVGAAMKTRAWAADRRVVRQSCS